MFSLVPFNRKSNAVASRNDLFDLSNVFDNFFGGSFMPAFFTSAHPIRTDVRETDKEFIIEADLPGIKKEDIKIDLKDGTLTIGVEHNEQVNEEKDNYIRRERRCGSYCRSFSLNNVNQENVSAKYSDGVLTVNLPKLEETKPKSRTIDIE